jgi:putative nucleotidyltransferase with HDIG domain
MVGRQSQVTVPGPYDRAAAWECVQEFTASPSLRRNMLAVEAAMAAYARLFGEDEDLWATVGLLHDFDYERHQKVPDHPVLGERILEERGWPPEIRRAILSHASYTGVERVSRMEKALHACDDVTGFLAAVALVQPSRDIRQVEMDSVRRKWKTKAFAGGVDRDEVTRAAEDLGVGLDEHVAFVLSAMQSRAHALGLAGAESQDS